MNTRLLSYLSHLKRPYLIGGIVLVLVVLGFFIFGRNGGGEEELLTLTPGEFVQEVSVSGTIVATEDVDLAFAESGRVERIYVKVGDKVTRGQPLIALSTGTLHADLLSARADLAIKRAEAADKATNVDKVREQQDTLVQSAYREMLSDDLVAVSASSQTTATPPVITGLYTGKEGTYKIRIVRENAGSDDLELRTFDLETSGPVEILDDEPTQLGTKGLYLSLPDAAYNYIDTVWNISIPNVKSSSYRTNYSAYQEALRTRDREINDAEAQVRRESSLLTVSQAEIARAEANVARIEAELAERTIRAPFSGTVTDIQAELGGTTGASDPALSLISDATLQIESFVPEINIPLLAVGDPAIITLDAYGADVPFAAKVIFIDPAETIRDGVSTYRAKLEFNERDERVRAGMTANIVITTEKKSDVLSVPQGVVIDRDGRKFVLVKQGDESVEREVTIGGVSSVGQVEITSGLSAGDVVVLTSE
jgi:RND family efflux transporter MFP subunit